MKPTSNRPGAFTASVAAITLTATLAGSVWLAQRNWPAATDTACTFGRPAPPGAVTFAPTAQPPTAVPTEAPAATDTAAPPEGGQTAQPEGYYSTEAAAEATASVARATQSPFATAQPVAVQVGPPAGAPSIAIARRDGLTFQVHLSNNAYLNGETGQADATLSNDGPETVFVGDGPDLVAITLLDGQGHPAPDWPWTPVSMPGPPYLPQTLAPGQSVTSTVMFHVAGPAPTYALWAETGFSRASPTNPQSADNLWLRLQAGPIPLQVAAPAPSQQLHAQLQADQLTFSLRVTDAAGQVPAGPFTGGLEAASDNSFQSRPLADNPGGVWSAGWGDSDFSGPFIVRAWVGAPGYSGAVVSLTVDGPADAGLLFYTAGPPRPRSYGSLSVAQAALGIPLYRFSALPAGATMDSIQAEASASSDFCSITAHQRYLLPGGAVIELNQFYANPSYENDNWGNARWDSEAQVLSVGGQPAYLLKQFGWWTLDWKAGDDGLELRAPQSAFTSSQMIELAESVWR